jgi:hypothetical protein
MLGVLGNRVEMLAKGRALSQEAEMVLPLSRVAMHSPGWMTFLCQSMFFLILHITDQSGDCGSENHRPAAVGGSKTTVRQPLERKLGQLFSQLERS